MNVNGYAIINILACITTRTRMIQKGSAGINGENNRDQLLSEFSSPSFSASFGTPD